MNIPVYLIVIFSFIVSLASCAKAPVDTVMEEKQARPNVIVILADDMQIGVTGYEGNPIIKTPNIDNLANNGTVFSKAFATSAVCTPSRTTLLTGLYERRHGINFNSNSSMTETAYNKTYPMLLKKSGYFVGYVGKNHTPIGRNESGVTGYKSGVMDNSFDYWYASHKHLSFYPKDHARHAIFKNAQADTQIEIIEEGVENFMTPNEAFQKGHNFLDSRPKSKPFALLINFNVPHANSTGSMELRDSDLELYKTTYREHLNDVALPKTYAAAKDIKTPKLPKSVYNGKYLETYDYVKEEDSLKERIVREMQTISGIDKLIGKLVKHLKYQGVADNTIIVFTSDHGLMHGEFGLGGKVHLYDPSVRIPMVIYDPRIEKIQKIDKNNDLVALVDLAPTILDLTNTPIPKDYQGFSLQPLMNVTSEKKAHWRQEIFLENLMTIQNYPRMEGVRTHKWKYIRYFDKKKDQDYASMSVASINGEQPIYEELYDLENDPNEINNVINVPENSMIVNKLRAKDKELVKEYRGNEPLNTYVN
ncbi:sulfatase-like hydrolase/transferase [Pseudocolwellia sp. AS88]|uniref:sulfatase-like hydrolase/transferase n=1 Tax=Pseudocolwellia sp. AS88 TaxID=3063958 RepID=UPI0026F05A5A|nr:sulfatase-like hydrolase/transferase [Pseudocolwellia sp. AS88]MDO7085587.1 sulfatase-like hydrolase/transferase [Pseudocolwellia sp. AS88]